MAVIDRVPLGASTLNRKWFLDVDTDDSADSPAWVGVFGLMEFQPALEPTLQDDSDFDSSGQRSQTKTAQQWSLVTKLARKSQADAPTEYDPGQEHIRGKQDLMGIANRVHVRWYEVTEDGPTGEAWEGWAAVSWSPDGGGMDALDMVSVTLTGQGARTVITHPAGSLLPAVTALSAAGGSTSGGELIVISGSGFTGATAVAFGVTAATDFEVISGTRIAAVAPAHAGGSVQVKVTTPAGASVDTAADNYLYA